MKHNILYSFRRCPYAIRARWALLNTNQLVELREVELKNKPIELIQISKKATVPVLKTSLNKVIDESLEIMIWSIKRSNMHELFGDKNKDISKEILSLIKINDNAFKYHLDRFKYSTRFNSIDKEYHFLEASKFIKRWNELLTKNRCFFGDNHTIADWCIWPFVRQFKIACESQKKINFFQPTTQKWLEYFENHRNFKDLMYKYTLWEPSSKKNYFPFN